MYSCQHAGQDDGQCYKDACLSIISSKIKTTPSLITSINDIESFEEILPRRSQLVRKLPTSRGGLGLRAGADISKSAWLSSMLFSTKWLYQNLPYFLPQFLPTVVLPQSLQILNEVVTVSENALLPFGIDPSPEVLNEYFQLNKPTPRQKELVIKLVDDVNMKTIIDYLTIHIEFKSQLAWFRGQTYKHTGKWLKAATTNNKALKLTDPAFLTSLRTRLLLKIIPINLSADIETFCRCCKSKKLEDGPDDYHCFSCPGYNGPKKAIDERHNNTVQEVLKVLKYVYPPQTHTAEAEKFLLDHRKPGKPALKADILVKSRNPQDDDIIIDVMHTNAASKAKVNSERTDKKALNGARSGELSKIRKYNGNYIGVYAALLIPLLIEASGALGQMAMDFFNNLFNVPGVNKPGLSKALSWMFDRLSHHQAIFLETMVREAHYSRSSYRLAEDPPPSLPVADPDNWPPMSPDDAPVLPPIADPDIWPPLTPNEAPILPQPTNADMVSTFINEPPIDRRNSTLLMNVLRNTSSVSLNSVGQLAAPPGLTQLVPPRGNNQQLPVTNRVVVAPLQGSSSSSSRTQQAATNHSVEEAEFQAEMAEIILGNHDD